MRQSRVVNAPGATSSRQHATDGFGTASATARPGLDSAHEYRSHLPKVRSTDEEICCGTSNSLL